VVAAAASGAAHGILVDGIGFRASPQCDKDADGDDRNQQDEKRYVFHRAN